MPTARIRSVSRMIESPMPDSGPISADLIVLMDEVSNSSSFAFFSSIEAIIPPIKLESVVVQLRQHRTMA